MPQIVVVKEEDGTGLVQIAGLGGRHGRVLQLLDEESAADDNEEERRDEVDEAHVAHTLLRLALGLRLLDPEKEEEKKLTKFQIQNANLQKKKV